MLSGAFLDILALNFDLADQVVIQCDVPVVQVLLQIMVI